MPVAFAGRALTEEQRRPHLDLLNATGLALVCGCAGVAPLAARWIPDDAARIACGVLVAAAFLAFSLVARARSSLRQFRDVSFAFFVLALVQVLNNAIPGYVGTSILHDPPGPGDPLASTVSGTVVVQLVETAIAIVPVIALTRLSGRDLGSLYVRGPARAWLVSAIAFFVVFYLFLATAPLRPDGVAQRLLPTNGVVTLGRFLALSPALLVMAISNGFEEELLFRGLFLQNYAWLFGARVANVLQAAVFSFAHAGVTYTPSALLFIIIVVFPFGLLAGSLMRASNSIIVPGIVHAAVDLAIYLAFLSYASG
jgi:membrane protease YdiL (CAAX protease family)